MKKTLRLEEPEKKNIMWALHLDSAGFLIGTELTRRDLIKGAIKDFGHSWTELKKHGYSARKVCVVEVLK